MLSNLKTTDVRSRIEPELKDRAANVLAECGLNLSDAIRLFLRQVVAQQGLPFEIRTPNAVTVAAMKEARAIGHARFGSAQKMIDDLEKAGAADARETPERSSDRTRQFADEKVEQFSHSGRYDMRQLKEAMLLLITNDEPLSPEYLDHELGPLGAKLQFEAIHRRSALSIMSTPTPAAGSIVTQP